MIEFLRDWRRYRAGDTWEPGRPVENVLIRRGIARRVVETATIEPPTEQAVLPRAKPKCAKCAAPTRKRTIAKRRKKSVAQANGCADG